MPYIDFANTPIITTTATTTGTWQWSNTTGLVAIRGSVYDDEDELYPDEKHPNPRVVTDHPDYSPGDVVYARDRGASSEIKPWVVVVKTVYVDEYGNIGIEEEDDSGMYWLDVFEITE